MKHFQQVTGVKTDFETLLKRFTETETVRYEEFSAIWRDMKMYLFYSGRQNDCECREFLENCLNIACQFLLPPVHFQVRVGALYLLYGLYNTQPCVPKVKIRMTLEFWSEVRTLYEAAKSQHHYDVAYIITRMRVEKTFHFVATPFEIVPNMNEAGRVTSIHPLDDTFQEEKSLLSELFNESLLEHFDGLHNQYHEVKCRLAGPTATEPDRSLSVLNQNLKTDIKQILTEFTDASEKKKRLKARKKKTGQSGTGTSSEAVDSDYVPESRGSKRARLKAKAFSATTKPKASWRHRQTDSDSPIKSPESKRAKKKHGNVSEEAVVKSESAGPLLSMHDFTQITSNDEADMEVGSKKKRTRRTRWPQIQKGKTKQKASSAKKRAKKR